MKGYRRLKVGEIIKEGDIWKQSAENAYPAVCCIGERYTEDEIPLYRPIKPKPSMWIEVEVNVGGYQYYLKRRNGKGCMYSNQYESSSACVWMAKRTAKALGLEYRSEFK